jgi:hypothetical protein
MQICSRIVKLPQTLSNPFRVALTDIEQPTLEAAPHFRASS